MDSKLSVIIPLYNGKKYIEKIVVQLLNIKSSVEIIIVDDGSTDGGYNFCKDIFSSYPMVHVYQKKNGGIASARNYGLNQATGDYILFVDQDDEINPNAVNKILGDIYLNKTEIYFWSTSFKFPSGITQPCDLVFRNIIHDENYIKSTLVPSLVLRKETDDISYLGHIWSCIISHRLITDNALTIKHYIDYEDDLIFLFDALSSAKTVGFHKDVGYFWNVNEQSYSHKEKRRDNYLEKAEKLYAYFYRKLIDLGTKEDMLENVNIYRHQKIVIEYIRNQCKEKLSWSDLKDIKQLANRDEYRSAIKKKSLVKEDRRFGFILFLLKYRSYLLCIITVRIYYMLKNWKTNNSFH